MLPCSSRLPSLLRPAKPHRSRWCESALFSVWKYYSDAIYQQARPRHRLRQEEEVDACWQSPCLRVPMSLSFVLISAVVVFPLYSRAHVYLSQHLLKAICPSVEPCEHRIVHGPTVLLCVSMKDDGYCSFTTSEAQSPYAPMNV